MEISTLGFIMCWFSLLMSALIYAYIFFFSFFDYYSFRFEATKKKLSCITFQDFSIATQSIMANWAPGLKISSRIIGVLPFLPLAKIQPLCFRQKV